MGVEPFLVASSLVGVLAQRLIRTICERCKTTYVPSAEELAELNISAKPDLELYRGEGCVQCGGTGYVGRMGIYELMLVDDEIRKLILQNVDAGSLRTLAKEKGLFTLREDGAEKVLSGLTTVAEVRRVTQEDKTEINV